MISLRLCFAMLLLVVLVALTLHYVEGRDDTTKDWKMYTSSNGIYSFRYPPNWVVSDCAYGGIVVADRSIDECYFPLDAPLWYLESVQIQVYPPGSSTIPSAAKSSREQPAHLRNYIFAYIDAPNNFILDVFSTPSRNIWSNVIPVNPHLDKQTMPVLYSHDGSTEFKVVDQLSVGFALKSASLGSVSKVIDSFQIHER